MNAVWDLVTTEAGPEIRYQNLHTLERMFVGIATGMTAGDILDHMLRTGCQGVGNPGSEFVRWDGVLLLLLPRLRGVH